MLKLQLGVHRWDNIILFPFCLPQELQGAKQKPDAPPKVAQDSGHHIDEAVHTDTRQDVVKIQHSSDDLRMGDFEFVVDESMFSYVVFVDVL